MDYLHVFRGRVIEIVRRTRRRSSGFGLKTAETLSTVWARVREKMRLRYKGRTPTNRTDVRCERRVK